jgi:hypothetical protein
LAQWPFSYDACDYGTIKNQSINGMPPGAVEVGKGDEYHDDKFSFLPGQRLSRCTCSGESHPGPMHTDGTYVGRAAPELDILEAVCTRSCAFSYGRNLNEAARLHPALTAAVFRNLVNLLYVCRVAQATFIDIDFAAI